MSERSFTGDIAGLEVGMRFIVYTSAGNRPRRDTVARDTYRVTRREERRVTAQDDYGTTLDERLPIFQTYTRLPEAPLSRYLE